MLENLGAVVYALFDELDLSRLSGSDRIELERLVRLVREEEIAEDMYYCGQLVR